MVFVLLVNEKEAPNTADTRSESQGIYLYLILVILFEELTQN